MADEQSPTVEIAAPTVVISNSNEGETNDVVDSATGGSTNTGEDNSGNDTGTGSVSSHDNGNAEDSASPIVAVAEIEADRDITLAAIHDETERERIRLEAERIAAIDESNQGYTECQREIQELRETVQKLTDLLIPPLPLEMVTEEQSEIAPEPNLTEPSIAAPIPETLMEPSEESEEERPVVETPSRGRKYIAI